MAKKPRAPDKPINITLEFDKLVEEDMRKPDFQVWFKQQLEDPLTRAVVEAIEQDRGILSLYRVFDEFDPLSGSVNDWPLDGVAQRARDIVGHRSAEELCYA